MSLLEQVREASMYKFMAQGEAYFPRMHTTCSSLEQLQAQAGNLVDGTFVMVIDKVTPDWPRLKIAGFRLVEAIVFEGEYVYLTVITNHRLMFLIRLAPQKPSPPVESISLSLICTEHTMYLKFLDKAVAHYTEALADFDFEICLAYYGNSSGPHSASVRRFHDDFHMAQARNRSMALCGGSHILMVSLDCLLSRDQVVDLAAKIPQTNGIINFCKPTRPWPGNALILGERTKMTAQGHHEGFQGFFFEDTEYLMNLARTGSVPWCYFVDFDYTDHPRGATRGWFPKNQEMFESILKGVRP